MSDIPDTWPPEPPPVLPLFALPDVWLFPGVLFPLHVFEERYVRLVEDSLDGQGRLAIGTFRDPSADPLGAPPIHPVAGLGEIGRHDKLEGGRYSIVLVGLKRIRVTEVESDRAYRKVRVESADEIAVAPEREGDLRRRLEEAILQRTETAGPEPTPALPAEVAISRLADLLALKIPLPPELLTTVYCELDEEKRAETVLSEHTRRP